MTPEQQRIAIAEACGWEISMKGMVPENHQHAKPPGGSWGYFDKVPDYLNDLNAMREAEKIFDKTQRSKYANELHDVILTEENEDDDTEIDFAWLSATAAQRAEAFLRTIGKWVES